MNNNNTGGNYLLFTPSTSDNLEIDTKMGRSNSNNDNKMNNTNHNLPFATVCRILLIVVGVNIIAAFVVAIVQV
jgi:hypothetical protein